MSTLAEQPAALNEKVERRFYPRIAPSAPIYIAFDKKNQGMLVNIGENGLLVSTPVGLPKNFVCRVSIGLDGLAKPIEVNVRVLWTTESNNHAGIQMLDLNEFDREQIRKWAAREHLREAPAERPASREESIPPQVTRDQRKVAAEAPEKAGSAANAPSPEAHTQPSTTRANTVTESAAGWGTQTGPFPNVP